MKYYPYTLRQYIEIFNPKKEKLDNIYSKVIELITKFHSKNYFHGDLHGDNIVCNDMGTKFKLIDFQQTTYISLIEDESFEDFKDDFNSMFETKCNTLEDILNAELLGETWKNI